jgi:hypothetical protein
MRQIVLIVFLFLCLCVTPRANSQALESKFTHRTQTVRLIVPSELKNSLSDLKLWSEAALGHAERKLSLSLQEDVEIYFDTEPHSHNGLTTAIPRNRIFVNTEAPELNSSIGISRFYMMETLVHEWAHMLSLQHHRGVFRGLSWVLGNTSRPNGAWPRWIHEGLAVWTEESVGGRPLSGSIDFDLRRYAEFSRRSGRPALNNSLLDGQWELSKFRPGQVPYSFGFLIFKKLSEDSQFSLGRFAEASSKSLGISFRKTFQELGVNLDKTFEELQTQWAATPLEHATTPAKLVAEGSEIRGLKSSASRVAWIESIDDDGVQFVATDSSHTIRRDWPFKLLSPLWALPVESSQNEERWAVLVETLPAWTSNAVHSPTAPYRRRLVLFDAGKPGLRCSFDLGDRLRDVALTSTEIAWTTSTDDARQTLQRARWNSSCEIEDVKTILEVPAFGRLSSPEIFGDLTFVTRNVPSETSFDERILSSDGRELISVTKGGLLTQYSPSRGGRGVIFERSPSYWGPLITREESGLVEIFKLPLRTGAFEATLSPDASKIYYIEKLWDRDELRVLSVDDPSLKRDRGLRWETASKVDVSASKLETPSEKHSSIDSIWPHFWIPSLIGSEGTWIIAGQTFYSDLTRTWSGASLAGYNTGTGRAFASSSLSWVPSSKRAWPQVDLHLEYSPRDVSYFGVAGQKVQDRASGDLAATIPYALEARWRGQLSIGYSLRHYGRLGNFEGENKSNPFLSLSFKSSYGRKPYSTLSRLSESPAYFYFEQRARWLEGPELQSDLYGLLRTSSRTRLLLALQGAHTEFENFPRSYFVWGGTPLLAAGFEGNYLNRGFPSQGFVAERLLRTSTEWIWGVWTPRSSLSWNRFRIQGVDLRLVAESVTWDSFFNKSYRLGSSFASSAGAEVDILGSGLHYISYKLSLGAFRGFGDFADTHYTAQLRVGLDL